MNTKETTKNSIEIIGKRMSKDGQIQFRLKRGNEVKSDLLWESIETFEGNVDILRHLVKEFDRKCLLLKYENNIKRNKTLSNEVLEVVG